MTANPQPILDFIIHDMNRSATVEKAYGAYTHHELKMCIRDRYRPSMEPVTRS